MTETSTEQQCLSRLRQEVERKAQRTMHPPKDFEVLRELIFQQSHLMVSTTTLRRIWGYQHDGGVPRRSSLNPLAQYVGFADYRQFEESLQEDFAPDNSILPPPDSPSPRRRFLGFAVLFLVVILIASGLFCYRSCRLEPFSAQESSVRVFDSVPPSGKRVLHKGGDCFRQIEEYLPLFGIANGDTAYFRPVPGLKKVFVWGPEYGHPVWHNEGDSAQLMPTITEYWIPLQGTDSLYSSQYVQLVNEKLYYEHLEDDELRITFMRNIVDGFYLFLGIYRIDREQSSRERVVWRRVADHCDLGNLKAVELLRNE